MKRAVKILIGFFDKKPRSVRRLSLMSYLLIHSSFSLFYLSRSLFILLFLILYSIFFYISFHDFKDKNYLLSCLRKSE